MSKLIERRFLIIRVGGQLCALPLSHVVETLRPVPIVQIGVSHPFLKGISIVRGVPMPVIDAAVILSGSPNAEPVAHACVADGRFVTLRIAGRVLALAVSEVLGVNELGEMEAQDLPPLLRDASTGIVESIGTLDNELLLFLSAGRILPEELWKTLMAAENADAQP